MFIELCVIMCICIFNGVGYKLEYIIYKLIIYDELFMSIYIV